MKDTPTPDMGTNAQIMAWINADDHIEGSQNCPVREALLSGDIETAMAELDGLPDNKELVMVCDAGVASTETARLLQDQDRDASALDGGLDAWKREQE